MKNSHETLETARLRYLQAKSDTDVTISDHMSRSTRLLKQVRSSIHALHNGFTTQDQSSYVHSLSNNRGHASDSDGLVDDLRLPKFSRRNVTSVSLPSSKQMTQAAWIAQASTVHSNLSKISNWEDNVKIPEILLTDPADVLCDSKTVFTEDREERKDMLSQLLNDTSYEMALEADISNSYRNGNLFSTNMASVLDYSKMEVDSAKPAANHELVSTLINDTYKGLEGLCHEWPTAKGTMVRNMNKIDDNLHTTKDSNDDSKLSNIEALYLKTFGTRSGVLNNDKTHTLTHALLHINEMDKNKEAELAPKMCTTHIPKKNNDSNKTLPTATTTSETPGTTISIESTANTNILEGINILSENKFGINLHKMSDFEPSFAQKPKTIGDSIEIQTDDVTPPEPTESDPLKSHGRVKVVYSGKRDQLPGSSEITPKSQISATQTAADASAQLLVNNVKPRLTSTKEDIEVAALFLPEPGQKPTVKERRELYQHQMLEREKAAARRWREQRAPLYAQIQFNERCGMPISAICRGGRRGGSHLTHAATKDHGHAPSSLRSSTTKFHTDDTNGVDRVSSSLGNDHNSSPRLEYGYTSRTDCQSPTTLIYESPSNKAHSAALATQKSRQPTIKSQTTAGMKTSDSPRIVRGYYGYDDISGSGENGLLSSSRLGPFFATTSAQQPKPSKALVRRTKVPHVASACNPFRDFEGWWKQHSIPLGGLREQLSIS